MQSSSDPTDQKLILAQVALIERQLDNIKSGLPPLDQEVVSAEYEIIDDQATTYSSFVDDDELALILSEVC